MNRYNRNNN